MTSRTTTEPPPAVGRPDVAATLSLIEGLLADLAPELVPERVRAHELARVVRSLGVIERRAAGARVVLTKPAADIGAWRAAGCRSAEEWVARQNGTTLGEARSDLKASERLADLPATREAAVSGGLSTQQTKAVAEGAAADPTAERSLLDKTANGDLRDVRDEARRVCTRVAERDRTKARRQFERRGLRTWLELDGEGRGSWNVPPGYQATFAAALEPYRKEAFRIAREAGRRETPEALMADALHLLARDVLADLGLDDPSADNSAADNPDAMTEPDHQAADARAREATTEPVRGSDDQPIGAAPPLSNRRHRRAGHGAHNANRRAPAQIVVHVDYVALMRGHAGDGEMCEVVGLGPVPVSLVVAMMDDALLRILVTGSARDVTVIASDRRYVPAPMRVALEQRDRECIVPGCHATHNLEIDHVHIDFARGGLTSLDNLARLCHHHHALKTHAGYRLTGRPGHWQWHPP